jgi:hypothetical protein
VAFEVAGCLRNGERLSHVPLVVSVQFAFNFNFD